MAPDTERRKGLVKLIVDGKIGLIPCFETEEGWEYHVKGQEPFRKSYGPGIMAGLLREKGYLAKAY